MPHSDDFRCVNCGEPAVALFKSYGPTVLKLTKCDKCKGIVDKYVEYDPVIVMIDLVLMSKEAQRHVLYNTEFKSYWKLLIILMMLETYGVWRSDSVFNIAVNSMCGIHTNNTINLTHLNIPLDLSLGESWRAPCAAWRVGGAGEGQGEERRGGETELFIWEKDFYIKFTSVFAGVVAFILTVKILMKLMKPFISQNNVSTTRMVKAFSLAHVSTVFALGALVWGAQAPAATRAAHLALVAAYTAACRANVITVLFDCPLVVTILILTVSNIVKYATSFYITPYLRSLT